MRLMGVSFKSNALGISICGDMSRRQSRRLFYSIHLHEATIVTSAGVRRASDECLIWDLALEAMDRCPSHDDDFLGFTITAEADHLFGLQTSSALSRTISVHSGWATTRRRETLTLDVRWLAE